jgi:hypothetical protein
VVYERLSFIILLSMELIRDGFFPTCYMSLFKYFRQRVDLIVGRASGAYPELLTAIVLDGGKKLHVPSSNFDACLFVL